MHYSAYAFAMIPFIPTIFAPRDKKIGQRIGMSDVRITFLLIDFYQLNIQNEHFFAITTQ